MNRIFTTRVMNHRLVTLKSLACELKQNKRRNKKQTNKNSRAQTTPWVICLFVFNIAVLPKTI